MWAARLEASPTTRGETRVHLARGRGHRASIPFCFAFVRRRQTRGGGRTFQCLKRRADESRAVRPCARSRAASAAHSHVRRSAGSSGARSQSISRHLSGANHRPPSEKLNEDRPEHSLLSEVRDRRKSHARSKLFRQKILSPPPTKDPNRA
jgi:hypothetical protein